MQIYLQNSQFSNIYFENMEVCFQSDSWLHYSHLQFTNIYCERNLFNFQLHDQVILNSLKAVRVHALSILNFQDTVSSASLNEISIIECSV